MGRLCFPGLLWVVIMYFDATGVSKRNSNISTTEVKVASGAKIRILDLNLDEVLWAVLIKIRSSLPLIRR